MNKEWSELCKTMQTQIKKEATFSEGVGTLLLLRAKLMDELYHFREELNREEFDAIPFINADGYHNKTIAYSIWHIARIEDIVVHTLIMRDEQIFFAKDYQRRIHSPIITTGNELVKQEIADFSSALDLSELYHYIADVKSASDAFLRGLSYMDLKRKISDKDKESLRALNVVSNDERACWLIDYWCKKDVRGLIRMPLSRHWIMHVEAGIRIKDKLSGNCSSFRI